MKAKLVELAVSTILIGFILWLTLFIIEEHLKITRVSNYFLDFRFKIKIIWELLPFFIKRHQSILKTKKQAEEFKEKNRYLREFLSFFLLVFIFFLTKKCQKSANNAWLKKMLDGKGHNLSLSFNVILFMRGFRKLLAVDLRNLSFNLLLVLLLLQEAWCSQTFLLLLVFFRWTVGWSILLKY